MTEFTLRLVMTRALSMTLRAYIFLVFFYMTFQTLPNPPFPTILMKLKLPLLSTMKWVITLQFFLGFGFGLVSAHD